MGISEECVANEWQISAKCMANVSRDSDYNSLSLYVYSPRLRALGLGLKMCINCLKVSILCWIYAVRLRIPRLLFPNIGPTFRDLLLQSVYICYVCQSLEMSVLNIGSKVQK